jgi:hypothetical protein
VSKKSKTLINLGYFKIAVKNSVKNPVKKSIVKNHEQYKSFVAPGL